MIKIPEYLDELELLPEDPPYYKIYGFWGNEFNALVKLFPVHHQLDVMSYDEQELIDGIHNSLANDQGIIKVERTKTSGGNEFIYSIIKTHMKEYGVQYFLRLQMLIGNKFYEINAFFGEEGVTGKRDAAIFAQYMENKKDKTSSDGWTCDPYDSTFQKGLLMNLSEEQFYDRYFPNHPLTKCRELIKFIKENN